MIWAWSEMSPMAVPTCGTARTRSRAEAGTVGFWAVKSVDIAASSPSAKGPLFEPTNSKVYRHPTFFEIPEKLGHM